MRYRIVGIYLMNRNFLEDFQEAVTRSSESDADLEGTVRLTDIFGARA